MIIDDSEVDRYLLKRQLEGTGLNLSVFEQPDGADAIEFLSNYATNRELYPDDFPPMLIFLDVNMPKLDGWGFLKEFDGLREQLEIKSTVIVLFTSSEHPDDRAKAARFPFVRDYLVKGGYTAENLRALFSTQHG